MGAELIIKGDGVEKLRALGVQLKGADKTLRRELQVAVRAAAGPIVIDVRQAVMAIPVGGGHGGGLFARAAWTAYAKRRPPRGGHGLRSSIAAATGTQVKTTGRSVGVKIRVNVAKLPPSQRKLPRDLDSPTGWRHPVFGNTAVWVAQAGHPYFKVTIARHQAGAKARIETAMDVIALKLSR